MKIPTFATLGSYAPQHAAMRPVNGIAVWAWIAGVILIVVMLGAALSPRPHTLGSGSSPATEQVLLPRVGQPLLPSETLDPHL
jgi:hypothetical protein